jgi:predicted TIM-barrel fold metal-dependent hydrolase
LGSCFRELRGVIAQLQRVYADTAGNTQDTMDDLRDLGMLGNRVMFGTDHPYGQNAIAGNLQRLVGFKLNPAELDAIGRETALRLFPKFKA